MKAVGQERNIVTTIRGKIGRGFRQREHGRKVTGGTISIKYTFYQGTESKHNKNLSIENQYIKTQEKKLCKEEVL